jgi:RNA polymerase sigma-70 factor (ECF subfamily)
VDSTDQLLKRARAYDEAALGQLYDRYAPHIYAYLYRRVRSVQVAEDLTGDVFVRMLEALQSERMRHDAFQAWLYRIAHNLLVDHYRRAQVRGVEVPVAAAEAVSSGDHSGPGLVLLEPERSDSANLSSPEGLGDALAQLTSDQQQVLALRFGQELTSRETARVMDKTVGAVEALQRRALAALQRLLGDREE